MKGQAGLGRDKPERTKLPQDVMHPMVRQGF